MWSNVGTAVGIAAGVALLATAVKRKGGPVGSTEGILLTMAGLALIGGGAVSCGPLYSALGID